jgi:hypothetical protein
MSSGFNINANQGFQSFGKIRFYNKNTKNYEPQAPFHLSEAPAYRSGPSEITAKLENSIKSKQYQAKG